MIFPLIDYEILTQRSVKSHQYVIKFRFKTRWNLGVMNTCNPSSWELRQEDQLELEATLGHIVGSVQLELHSETLSENKTKQAIYREL